MPSFIHSYIHMVVIILPYHIGLNRVYFTWHMWELRLGAEAEITASVQAGVHWRASPKGMPML